MSDPFPQYKHAQVADLIPYARNSRTHSDAQVDKIAASIKEFGFLNPVIVDGEHGIIAGHGRIMAAKKLGMETVPVVEASHLTEAQRRAYVIADNRLALDAGWDDELLRVEFSELEGLGFDLELTGFEPEEIAALEPVEVSQGLTDEDAVPEEPEQPVTVEGDVWILGNHRLMCGDSTKAEDVDRLMAGSKAGIMVTDPPYGVNYDESWRECSSNDFGGHTRGTLQNDDRADWVDAYRLADASVAYVWHASSNAHIVRQNLIDSGFDVRQQVVWRKPFGVMSRSAYHWQHEPCWYAVRKNRSAAWIGTRTETTVWDATIPNHPMATDDDTRTEHPTQKPIEVMGRAIRNHDGSVYDPFLGSGTTLIAAEQLGRKCYGMELDPKYCDVIIKRWQDFTGQQAVHEGSGKTFAEMSSAR